MNEFKKNLIYMQWRYYIDVFLRRTNIVDIVKNMTGTNLHEAADDYINFMKDNNIARIGNQILNKIGRHGNPLINQ